MSAQPAAGTVLHQRIGLLPFDGAGGLVSNVVDHSVDLALEGVGDFRADFGQHVVRDRRVPRAHPIEARHRTNYHRLPVDSRIAMDADAPNRQEGCEVLPRKFAPPFLGCGLNVGLDDVAGLSAGLDAVWGELAENTNCETGAGEGLALARGDAELACDVADLVLVELL